MYGTTDFVLDAVWDGTSWTSTPNYTNNIILNGNYSGSGYNCNNLTISAGKQVTLSDNQWWIGGDLTLKSDATGTATWIDDDYNYVVAGTTKVEQQLQSGRTWYVSSPVNSASIYDINTITGSSMVSYSETTGTSAPWATEVLTMSAAKGYIIAPPTNSNPKVVFQGSLNSGDQTIQVTRTHGQTKEGFNLIGNPYPCYLNAATAINNNSDLEKTIWYRTRSTASTPMYYFETVNTSSGVGTNNSGIGAVTGLIPPMQAFWIRTATTTNVTFNIQMRSHATGSTTLLRSASASNGALPLIRLQVSNGSNFDETVIYAHADASNGLDIFDSKKMTNDNVALPELFSVVDNESLAINGLNQLVPEEIISLGFATGQANTFSLRANAVDNLDSNIKVILKDKLLGREFDLTHGDAYGFASEIAKSNDRFSIVLKANSNTTNITTENTVHAFVAMPYLNNRIKIMANDNTTSNALVMVYNSSGQLVHQQAINESETLLTPIFKSGVYIVKINGISQSSTSKLILN
jgi:hypothetical protein